MVLNVIIALGGDSIDIGKAYPELRLKFTRAGLILDLLSDR